MRKILVAAFLFTLLMPTPSLLYADETPEAKIERLIEKYGATPVIRVISRERGDEITVEVNGQLRNTQNTYRVKVLKPDSIHIVEVNGQLRTTKGVPVHNMVTSRSVLFDIEKAGLTVESFAALVQAEAERSQRARKVEVVEQSAEAIEDEKKRYEQQHSDVTYEYRQREMADTMRRAQEHDRALEEAEQAQARAEAAWRAEMREEERLRIEAEKVREMQRQSRALEGLGWEMERQKRALDDLEMRIPQPWE